tara:strand:- start:3389 stop:4105 length:717 start_codon:yes stop_codon:yes gene_type:complete
MATIRALFFFAAIWISFIIVVPPWMLFALIFRVKKNFTLPGKVLFKVLFPLCGVKIKIQNPENMKTNQTFLILSNHQSYLDVPVILTYIRLTAYMAKDSLFKIPVFGASLRQAGVLVVDQTNPRKNRDLGDRMLANLAKGLYYGVFPEGTRSRDCKLLPFKKGIFHYCVQAGIPILPVTFPNTGVIMPRKQMKMYTGDLDIIIHPIIQPEDYKELSSNQLKDKVYGIIESGFPGSPQA